MPISRFLAFAVAAAMVGAVTAAEVAPCSAVTGLYVGTAENGPDTIDVMLNLYCSDGMYRAQMFTSQGDFDVTDALSTGGHVFLKLDTHSALGAVDLTSNGGTLAGSFDTADDKGTMRLTYKGSAIAADAMTPRLDLTPAQWREDLAAFAAEVSKRHANPFFILSKEKFAAEVAALDQRIDNLDGDAVFVGLQQIAKMIGDGHTGLIAPADRRVMPIQFAKFGDDLRVVAVGPGLDAALGARLTKIGGIAADEVWQRVMTLTPQGEFEQLRRENALRYLSRGDALHGLGVITDRTHAVYTVNSDEGGSLDLDVHGLAPGAQAPMKSVYPAAALRFQNKDRAMWCNALPTGRTVYCAWRGYQDLARNSRDMLALIGKTNATKLVIDMRDNGGGDYTVGEAQMVKPLKALKRINSKSRLYVLIGAETFSAAMNNAAQFQDETNAFLVGETIGEKPNSYQEPRQFRLPNSHLVLRVSTRYYAFRKHGENVVRPHKEIIPSWNDVKSGRDPALEWVLAQPYGRRPSSREARAESSLRRDEQVRADVGGSPEPFSFRTDRRLPLAMGVGRPVFVTRDERLGSIAAIRRHEGAAGHNQSFAGGNGNSPGGVVSLAMSSSTRQFCDGSERSAAALRTHALEEANCTSWRY